MQDFLHDRDPYGGFQRDPGEPGDNGTQKVFFQRMKAPSKRPAMKGLIGFSISENKETGKAIYDEAESGTCI